MMNQTTGTSAGTPLRPRAERASSLDPRHPLWVYLTRLAPGSGRTMSRALNLIAKIASGGARDLLSFPWTELRYQHTAAIRSALVARYKPATANKMLAALRGVLKECHKLGWM